jgi:hypothetical protein
MEFMQAVVVVRLTLKQAALVVQVVVVQAETALLVQTLLQTQVLAVAVDYSALAVQVAQVLS